MKKLDRYRFYAIIIVYLMRMRIIMNWILYVMLTVSVQNSAIPLEHKFQLSFNNNEQCTEMKKVFDVGVSFFRLANKSDIKYEGTCKLVVLGEEGQRT